MTIKVTNNGFLVFLRFWRKPLDLALIKHFPHDWNPTARLRDRDDPGPCHRQRTGNCWSFKSWSFGRMSSTLPRVFLGSSFRFSLGWCFFGVVFFWCFFGVVFFWCFFGVVFFWCFFGVVFFGVFFGVVFFGVCGSMLNFKRLTPGFVGMKSIFGPKCFWWLAIFYFFIGFLSKSKILNRWTVGGSSPGNWGVDSTLLAELSCVLRVGEEVGGTVVWRCEGLRARMFVRE